MTLVKFKHAPENRRFNNLMDNFFNSIPSLYQDDHSIPHKSSIPVNIMELENGYALELVAPGFNKEDFKIDLDKNLLAISAEKKMEGDVKTEKHIRKEFELQSLTRSFHLDENIDVENISAQYVNGILILNLPKKSKVKEPAKQITIQ